MGNPSAAQEPSMEEILASIRQIISEDGDPNFAGHAVDEDEAEESADRNGSASLSNAGPALRKSAERGSERAASSTPSQGETMKTNSVSATVSAVRSPTETAARHEYSGSSDSRAVSTHHGANGANDRLLSDGVDTVVSGSFSALAHTILAQNARTLEDLVTEMLQPMLREWLDDNLPTLVERIVQEEIQRVSRGRR
jgi:uncharacterized protein